MADWTGNKYNPGKSWRDIQRENFERDFPLSAWERFWIPAQAAPPQARP